MLYLGSLVKGNDEVHEGIEKRHLVRIDKGGTFRIFYEKFILEN